MPSRRRWIDSAGRTLSAKAGPEVTPAGISNLQLFKPHIVEALQALLAPYPDWHITIRVAVPGKEGIWPGMGLIVYSDEVVDELRRDSCPRNSGIWFLGGEESTDIAWSREFRPREARLCTTFLRLIAPQKSGKVQAIEWRAGLRKKIPEEFVPLTSCWTAATSMQNCTTSGGRKRRDTTSAPAVIGFFEELCRQIIERQRKPA
jgi:hypothetical protein